MLPRDKGYPVNVEMAKYWPGETRDGSPGKLYNIRKCTIFRRKKGMVLTH